MLPSNLDQRELDQVLTDFRRSEHHVMVLLHHLHKDQLSSGEQQALDRVARNWVQCREHINSALAMPHSLDQVQDVNQVKAQILQGSQSILPTQEDVENLGPYSD